MRTTRKRAAAAATVAVLALTLTAACSSDGGSSDEPSASASGIPDAQRVGAMDDFAVGTQFEATEPVTFGVMYRDHPNYPLNEDWLFFSHLKDNNKVSFDLTSAPLSDWDAKKSLIISSGDAPDLIPVFGDSYDDLTCVVPRGCPLGVVKRTNRLSAESFIDRLASNIRAVQHIERAFTRLAAGSH